MQVIIVIFVVVVDVFSARSVLKASDINGEGPLSSAAPIVITKEGPMHRPRQEARSASAVGGDESGGQNRYVTAKWKRLANAKCERFNRRDSFTGY